MRTGSTILSGPRGGNHDRPSNFVRLEPGTCLWSNVGVGD